MVLSRARRDRCRQVAKLLQAYLDGEAAPRRASQVSAHLEECRQCGLDADTYRAIKSSIASYPAEASTKEAVGRLREFAQHLATTGSD